MNAQLIESDDEHHWVLLDHRVTQLVIDRSSIRIQTWSLDGSADIRLAAPFVAYLASGADPRLSSRQTMNHDVAPGRNAKRAGSRSMRRVRIRDPERPMIEAGRIPRRDAKEAFGCPVVAYALLVADRLLPQRDQIAAQ